MMLPVANTGDIGSILHAAAGSASKSTFNAVLAAMKKILLPDQVQLISVEHILTYWNIWRDPCSAPPTLIHAQEAKASRKWLDFTVPTKIRDISANEHGNGY